MSVSEKPSRGGRARRVRRVAGHVCPLLPVVFSWRTIPRTNRQGPTTKRSTAPHLLGNDDRTGRPVMSRTHKEVISQAIVTELGAAEVHLAEQYIRITWRITPEQLYIRDTMRRSRAPQRQFPALYADEKTEPRR